MKKPSVWEGRAGVEREREALSVDVDVGAAAAAGGGSYGLVGATVVLGRFGAVVAIVPVFLRLPRAADGGPRHRAGRGLAYLHRPRSKRIHLRNRRRGLGKLDAHNK